MFKKFGVLRILMKSFVSSDEYFKLVKFYTYEHVTGTTFCSLADSHGLLPIAALDRGIIALDGGLHRITRAFGGRLRIAVMLQRLIVRRSDRRVKSARDRADVVETGAQLIA